MNQAPRNGLQTAAAALVVAGALALLAALLLPHPYAPAFHPTNESLRLYQAATLEAGQGADVAPVFDLVAPQWRERGTPPNIDVAVRDDRWLLDKAPGITLLTIPVLRSLRIAGLQVEHNALLRWLALLLCAIPSILAALALARATADPEHTPLGTLPLAVLTLLATPWALYATRLFGHAAATAFLVLGTVLLLGRGPRQHHARDEAPTPTDGRPRTDALREIGRGLGAGLLVGLATLVETPVALAAILLTLIAALTPSLRRRAIGLVLGGALCAVALAAWNHTLFGSSLTFGYAFKWHTGHLAIHEAGAFGFRWPSTEALAGLFVSPHRGVLHLAPWIALGLVGVVVAAFDRRLPGPWRVVLPAMGIGYALWIAGFVDWEAGWSAGSRHLLPALPFLAAGAWRLPDVLDRSAPAAGVIARSALVGAALGAAVLVLSVSATTIYYPEDVAYPIARLSARAWALVGPYPILGVEGAAAGLVLRGLVGIGVLGMAGGITLGMLQRFGDRLAATALLVLMLAGGAAGAWSNHAWRSTGPAAPLSAEEVRAIRAGMELRLEERGPRERTLELPLPNPGPLAP
ncbi:MAG: hypothetical protein EA398_15455 [Deltaproteobacteria bacterium]|nr:MAG: hypothetical protein EA398_15455 [Deltaproteobacteria bacterium]